MTHIALDTARVLENNKSLRLWAEGLRSWSRSAREASSSERAHHRRVVSHASDASDVPPMPTIPSLGSVSMADLVAILAERHGFAEPAGRRALKLAALMSGLPSDMAEVPAADAFELIEFVVQHRS